MNLKKTIYAIAATALITTLAVVGHTQMSTGGFSSPTKTGPIYMYEQATDAGAMANRGIFYTKDVAGATEVFYKDPAANVIQLTAGGVLNPAAVSLTGHDVTELDDVSNAGSGIIITSLERTKLSGVEALADVTDATNVAAAGAVMTEVDPNALLTAGTDNVKDTHIDWGTGASQVSADDIGDGSTNAIITLTQESHLDGIEASADVTDATNVAAAGAVMAEADPLSATKALDNLSSVAINESLVSDTAATDSLGSEILYWLKGFFGSELSFEGATDDDYQTTLAVTDPTSADKTITFQDANGIVAMDATAVTDLEGTLLSISGGTLNAAEADTLDTVVGRGATTTTAVTFDSVTLKSLHVDYEAVTASTSTDVNSYIMGCDSVAADTVTIDTDTETAAGRILVVKDVGSNAGTMNITIDTEGASDIDGEDSVTIMSDGGSMSLFFDGTNWFIF